MGCLSQSRKFTFPHVRHADSVEQSQRHGSPSLLYSSSIMHWGGRRSALTNAVLRTKLEMTIQKLAMQLGLTRNERKTR